MSDLASKRERQARRLLRVCLREFEDGCLHQYVEDYEGGEMLHLSRRHCALGAMGKACEGRPKSDHLRSKHGRAAVHVENIFEGYVASTHLLDEPLWGGFSWQIAADNATRRRWIYEACIEELARRGAESVESVSNREVVRV